MKKIIVVGLAILAVSTSAALAKSKKPKEPAAAASTASTNPLLAGVSAADRDLYEKNKTRLRCEVVVTSIVRISLAPLSAGWRR